MCDPTFSAPTDEPRPKRVYKDDWPHTHTQYQDRGAEEGTVCKVDAHHWVGDDDDEESWVCSRCGVTPAEVMP